MILDLQTVQTMTNGLHNGATHHGKRDKKSCKICEKQTSPKVNDAIPIDIKKLINDNNPDILYKLFSHIYLIRA